MALANSEGTVATHPFDLFDDDGYARWREEKLACYPRTADALIVDVADPYSLSSAERAALMQRCACANMAIYRTTAAPFDKSTVRSLANQLGLRRLDCNWLADEDGISPIAVATKNQDRRAYIPYTNRAINWHTDGYYHPESRQVRGMVLHCVQAAQTGGVNALLDHEIAYITLRDTNPDWIRALMSPDAMTIPAREDDDGIARPEQSGPVFSVNAYDGALHMRYTARTRSVIWKDDVATRDAALALQQLLNGHDTPVLRVQLQPGMGLVCNNVLHDRSQFEDDPSAPRLLYRARYADRVARTQTEAA